MTETRSNREKPGARSRLLGIRTVWLRAQAWLVTIATVAFLVLQVSWINKFVDRYVPTDWLTLQIVLPAMLVILLWETLAVSVRLDQVERASRDVTGSMMSVLSERIAAQKKGRARSLDVLGVNLRYAWPSIRQMIDEGLLDGWKVHIGVYRPETKPPYVPQDWLRVADAQLDDIRTFAATKSLRRRNVELVAHVYEHLPLVHGYKLSNGDVFCAYLRWNAAGTKLTGATPRYEFIPRSDESPSGLASRRLFESWLRAAKTPPGDHDTIEQSARTTT